MDRDLDAPHRRAPAPWAGNRTRTTLAVLALALAAGAAYLWERCARFQDQRRDYLALLRSLPEAGITVDSARATLAQLDAVLAPSRRDPPDVLYFNDSTMGEGETSMAALLAGLSGRRVEAVSGAGFTPTVCRQILAAVRARRGAPRLVILPVNLRAFSNAWPFAREYHENLRRILDAQARPPLADCLACLAGRYSNAASYFLHRFRHNDRGAPAYFAGRPPPLAEPPPEAFWPDTDPDEMVRDFSEAYTVPVTGDHPLLREYEAMAEEVLAGGSRLLVYATPLDADRGESLLGPGFMEAVEDNVHAVAQALARQGVRLLDLSGAVGGEHFMDRDYVNEHLSPEGRALAAARLARALPAP